MISCAIISTQQVSNNWVESAVLVTVSNSNRKQNPVEEVQTQPSGVNRVVNDPCRGFPRFLDLGSVRSSLGWALLNSDWSPSNLLLLEETHFSPLQLTIMAE